MFSRVSADRRSLHGQQQLAVAQSAEKAAAEELESALQSLTALRKLRPAGLAQHLPQLVSTLSHVRWPVRECAMELLAKYRRLAEQTQEPSAADDGMLAPRRVRSV